MSTGKAVETAVYCEQDTQQSSNNIIKNKTFLDLGE